MTTKHKPKYKRVAQLKTASDFREYLKSVDAEVPFDPALVKNLEKASGYANLRPQIIFAGLCPECKVEA